MSNNTPRTISEFQGPYRWLSNFWPCSVRYKGDVYPSVEHAYQAAKTKDAKLRAELRKPGVSAADAKRWGRVVKVRKDWEDVKVKIMRELVHEKFKDPALRELLLSTGVTKLKEGNAWGDKFWGVDRETGEGENRLGVILMRERARIREEEGD